MLKNQQIVVLARKRKSKIWRVRSTPNRAQVHAKKEKARFGVCGAPPIGHRHTPEKKKQDLACAEPTPTGHRHTPSQRLQDEFFCKSVNLTQNYLLYKQAEA